MFVVTLPPSAAADPQAFALRAQAMGADLLEIRGDLTPDVQPFDSPLALLVSPRKKGTSLIQALHPHFVDLEMGEVAAIPPHAVVIRSFHDHTGTPSLPELQRIVGDLLATQPNIVKIATMIRSYADLQTLDALHQAIPSSQKRVILGMGPKAHLNRMLSPFKNALTYTYIDDGEEAAPGQIPFSLYAKTRHCRSPKLFGLLGGQQVTKSLSPLMHNALFESHKIDAMFSLFPTDDLVEAWTALTAIGIEGFSITAPFKTDIIPFLDELRGAAFDLQSVNTIVREGSKWIGSNTDVVGLDQGFDWKGVRSVAILGSGGVVPAVIHCCQARGIDDVAIYGRNVEKRKELAGRFHVREHALEDLPRNAHDCIVCAIAENVDVTLPAAAHGARAFDLRYGKRTQFLKRAEASGYAMSDGLLMLQCQGLEQFRLFTGITASAADRTAINSLFSV